MGSALLSPLTAIPFVAPHQLVIFGIRRIFRVELGGERLAPRQPRSYGLGEVMRGQRGELLGRHLVVLASRIDWRGDVAKAIVAFAERPIFEAPGVAPDALIAAAFRDEP